MGNRGKREFIQVLRLMEVFDKDLVADAVKDAIKLGAPGFDAVKQLILCRIERRPARLDLDSLSVSAQAQCGYNACGGLRRASARSGGMSKTAEKPQLLLKHHLKQLKLPTFLAEYEKQAHECAQAGVDHVRYLLRLAELELIERERRMVERRIRAAKFPAVKSLDSFDFTAIPSLNKMLVTELARGEYILRRENIIALGNSGTGKTHVALALGLAACQRGIVRWFYDGGRARPSADGSPR